MRDFVYNVPTRVYFGKTAESNIGPALKEFGATKVLVHFGGGSAKKSGLIEKIEIELDKAGLSYIELGGVEPNPKAAFVRDGIEFCKKQGIDFILAVGGGSVMDSAKAISLGMAYDGDVWDLFSGGEVPAKRIPIGAVITIAAAGSEMSESCVITNTALNLKRSCNNQVNRPQVAFLNPENTFSVSAYQTACGIVDIMMHTLERYFTGNEDTDPTDSFAEGVIRTARDAGRAALKDPCDYDARAALMWASALSHNDITGCGRTRWFCCHNLEHDISGVYDRVSHGAGLAVVWPAWAKFEYKNDIKRFAKYAKNVWDIEKETDEESALAGIEATKAFFREIGMPVTLAELGVSPDSYDRIANLTTNNGTKCIGSYTPLSKENVLKIYKLAED